MGRHFVHLFFARYNYNHEVKDDEIGKECSTYGIRIMHIKFWWRSWKERDN
jgi:hypothetical protein